MHPDTAAYAVRLVRLVRLGALNLFGIVQGVVEFSILGDILFRVSEPHEHDYDGHRDELHCEDHKQQAIVIHRDGFFGVKVGFPDVGSLDDHGHRKDCEYLNLREGCAQKKGKLRIQS